MFIFQEEISMSKSFSIFFARECALFASSTVQYPTVETNQTKPQGAKLPLTLHTCSTNLYIPNENNGGFNRTYQYAFHGQASATGRSRMGWVVMGRGNRKNEAVITFRGSKCTSDFLGIDAAFAPGTSTKGLAVHGGFAKVLQSCLPEIKEALRRHPDIKTVHCCGHSLGGALATLAAEYFCDSYHTPYLYTFGAPRVGLLAHTNYLKSKMPNAIFRYYYDSDIVTWLPMWPFVHLPGERLVTSNKVIGGHGNYFIDMNLVVASGDIPAMQSREQAWNKAEDLIRAGGSAEGGRGFESRGLRYFIMALNKILYAIGGAIGLVATSSVTIIDQIAATLAYCVNHRKERAPLIVSWIEGAAGLFGKIIKVTKDGMVGILRYVLNLMLGGARNSAHRELSAVEAWELRTQRRQKVLTF